MPAIDNFLAAKRIAFIGVSRNPKEFSRMLFREFRTRGYDVVPVHPDAREIEDLVSYPSIDAVTPPPEAAMLLLPKPKLADAVRACGAAGVRLVWAYGVTGEKEIPADAHAAAAEHGLDFIAGHCPFMLLPDTGAIHRFHGWIWSLLGKMPERV